MSLILEALRKREREKQVPERGFLVMAPTPWAPTRGLGLGVGLAAAVAAFGLGVAFMAWRAPRTTPTAPPVTLPPRAAPATLLPAPRPSLPVAAAALPATTTAPAPVPRAEPGPAQPAMPTPAPSADLVLQAISEKDGRPVAIINDRLMREGDEFDGARLVRIGEAEVELEIAGVRRVLRF